MALSAAEKQRAYRERKRQQEVDEAAAIEASASDREQAVRDLYGYGPSETRTQAERAAAAEAMLERSAV